MSDYTNTSETDEAIEVEIETTRDSQPRTSRSNLMRDNSYRDTAYEEPDYLDIPDSVVERFEQEGLVLRWVRISLKGKDDIANVARREQDGWSFVLPSAVPEMVDSSVVRNEGRYNGVVTRGDLALCATTRERALARREFYENKGREMMNAVNQQLENHQDPRMPIFNNSKSQVFNGQRKPKFQSDE